MNGLRVKCPYCGALADHVRNQWGVKYECVPCDARVGCHKGTDIPLGSLANAELRAARIEAHTALDRLWRTAKNKRKAREAAYAFLGNEMGLRAEQCHIGKFNLAQCADVVRIANAIRVR